MFNVVTLDLYMLTVVTLGCIHV